MTATTVASRPSEHVRVSSRRLLWAGPLAIVGAVAANAVVRAVELAIFSVPNDFLPLRAPSSFIGLTVAGMLGAVIVYVVVGRFSKNPVRTFRIVAGIALLLSFLPDLGLLVGGMPGATLTGVLALMMMHVVAAAIAVGVLTGLAVE